MPLIGVFEGEGVGPEVIRASLGVLDAVAQVRGRAFKVEFCERPSQGGAMVSDPAGLDSAAGFCRNILDAEGAVLCGPAGGRFVYELRRRFDLFCKFVPIRSWAVLANTGRLKSPEGSVIDILLIRDNAGGVYQGSWQEEPSPSGRLAVHRFSYSESQVRRLMDVACRAALNRAGRLCVVVKDGGIPGITALWRDVASAACREHGIALTPVNIDLAAYQLIQEPERFDVIVAPNLFGDILADLGGVLVGSRGLTYSGNFDACGRAVYQTNHGAAFDLAGRDVANPIGQTLSLAMLLRESFGLSDEARMIEAAISEAWRQGWRTADMAGAGCRAVGTREMGEIIARHVHPVDA